MAYIIINGPNLNLLGVREPSIYGSEGFDTYLTNLRNAFPELSPEYYQSNSEGALVDKLHEVGFSYDGIVLNAGAYTHTSVALADAVAAVSSPVVEVHISNVYAREAFRHHSYLSPHVVGVIVGCGLDGYRLALDYLEMRKNKL
jgi:3-dehydroquinate dehydratase-2